MARRRRRVGRRALVLGIAAAVVVAGAGTAWAMNGPDGPTYRLASATRADVEQTVDADGTLTARDRATLSFAVGGTVRSVAVSVGDKVSAGQVVARLDPSALEDQVTSQKQAVAQAQQRLAADEQAQADGTSSTATASSAQTGTDSVGAVRLLSARSSAPTGPASGTSKTGSAARSGVTAAQPGVEGAQRQLDTDEATLSRDLARVGSACDTPNATGSKIVADSSGTVTGSVGNAPAVVVLQAADTTSANPQTVGGGGQYSFAGLTAGTTYAVAVITALDGSDCTNALGAVQRDQSNVQADTKKLEAAIAKLAAQLEAAQGQTGSGSGSSGGRGGGSSGGTSSGRSTGSSGRSGGGSATGSRSGTDSGSTPSSGTTVTAAQIAADTEAIDAAQAELAVAEQQVGYATLTTPIAGTVGTVSISSGQSVSRSSRSATIVVVGAGALSAEVDIPLAQIDLVKVGEPVQVTVDGRSAPLAAKVSYVGGQNSSDSTGSSASYPVTVTLAAADARLFDGMGASVAIDVGTARNALTVPVSAVHTIGQFHTVVRYARGKAATQRVTLGVTGGDRVQITSGLSAGDRVVLADVDTPVPSSSTDNRNGGGSLLRLSGGGGGFGGGRLGGGRLVRTGGN